MLLSPTNLLLACAVMNKDKIDFMSISLLLLCCSVAMG